MPFLITQAQSAKINFKKSCNLVPINNNLIDQIYKLKKNHKIKEFYTLNKITAGEKISSKINKLYSMLKKDNSYHHQKSQM